MQNSKAKFRIRCGPDFVQSCRPTGPSSSAFHFFVHFLVTYVFLAFWEGLWKIRLGESTSRQGVHPYISEWTSRQGVHPYINEWTPPSGCASVHRPMDFPLWDVLEALFLDFGGSFLGFWRLFFRDFGRALVFEKWHQKSIR